MPPPSALARLAAAGVDVAPFRTEFGVAHGSPPPPQRDRTRIGRGLRGSRERCDVIWETTSTLHGRRCGSYLGYMHN